MSSLVFVVALMGVLGYVSPMKLMILALFQVFFLIGGMHSFAANALPEQKLLVQDHFFSYVSNLKIDESHPEVTQAIIVVAGSECNAGPYFNTIHDVASLLQVIDHTLVLAPHFKTPSKMNEWLPHELTWTDEGWLRGDASSTDGKTSSFEMIDNLIAQISNPILFPNLKMITLTGHSAGGQLTQRYALATEIEGQMKSIHLRYVVLNPGSYVYLNAKRPSLYSNSGFSIPENTNCAYNSYKYGLESLNSYLNREPVSRLISNYLSRDVIYMLGEQDRDTNEVDHDCAAELQGPYRYLRGVNFKAFLDHEYAGNHHQLLVVPGVAHTKEGMYTSAMGKAVLFPHFARSQNYSQ